MIIGEIIWKKQKGESFLVECHNPKEDDAYNDIEKNIENWIEEAIKARH